jgi:hypothetical protein
MASLERGSLTKLSYEGREFEVVVIDPDGLGPGQPSVGFGFGMMERNAGVPQSTLSTWVIDKEADHSLKLPSGKLLKVIEIKPITGGSSYSVIEASDWFTLAVDLIINPGRTTKSTRSRLGDFITWFAVKGFYAEAYVALKGIYDAKDSRATTKWMESRQLGIPARKLYTDLLQSQGCGTYDYANWTNRVYQGLFGMPAKEMKDAWKLMEGNKSIARNYVPEAEGLDAVRYCEDMVVRMFVDDLAETHDLAIGLAKRRFDLNFEGS